jgi:hypothetical protein
MGMPARSEANAPPPVEKGHSGASLPKWLLRHENFVRAMCMIALYVSGAVFLIAILLLNGLTLMSEVLLGIFAASLSIILALSRLKRRRS